MLFFKNVKKKCYLLQFFYIVYACKIYNKKIKRNKDYIYTLGAGGGDGVGIGCGGEFGTDIVSSFWSPSWYSVKPQCLDVTQQCICTQIHTYTYTYMCMLCMKIKRV